MATIKKAQQKEIMVRSEEAMCVCIYIFFGEELSFSPYNKEKIEFGFQNAQEQFWKIYRVHKKTLVWEK